MLKRDLSLHYIPFRFPICWHSFYLLPRSNITVVRCVCGAPLGLTLVKVQHTIDHRRHGYSVSTAGWQDQAHWRQPLMRAWRWQEVQEKGKAAGGGGLLSSFVRNLGMSVVGTAALSREDIQPALDALKLKLRERNVASEIADKCVHCTALHCTPGHPSPLGWALCCLDASQDGRSRVA